MQIRFARSKPFATKWNKMLFFFHFFCESVKFIQKYCTSADFNVLLFLNTKLTLKHLLILLVKHTNFVYKI